MRTKSIVFSILVLLGAISSSAFLPNHGIRQVSLEVPSGMTIKLDNTNALDYWDCYYYPNREIKVTFYGSRYSDGQNV